MEIRKEVEVHRDELIALRREFHRRPEIGTQEFRTSAFLFDYLQNLGLEVERCTETGVVALLKGKHPGKTLMIRSDIDALPVSEETGLPFASQEEGTMHACGHDGHMAILLIVAKILSKYRDEFHGQVKFVFQPNEEEAGAQLMIDAGVLENPKPDAIFGMHLWSYQRTGTIGIVPGPIMASSYYFKIVLHGKQGHGGAPHKAINPINAAAQIINAAAMMQSQEYDALKPTIISFGQIHAGTKDIIIPQTLEAEGSIRCLHRNDAEVRERFAALVEQIAAAYRLTAEISFQCGNSILDNDEALAALAMDVGADIVGKQNVLTKDVSVMIGDDFAEFVKDIPGVYYFVGVANAEKRTDYAHHHPKFDIDEDALPLAAEMQINLALRWLNDN